MLCDDQVLLVKTWLGSGRWGLPGGGVKRGELPIDAAIRELHEEVGIVATPEQLQYMFTKPYISKNNFHFNYSAYVLDLREKPKINLRVEISTAKWCNIADIEAERIGSKVVQEVLAACHASAA